MPCFKLNTTIVINYILNTEADREILLTYLESATPECPRPVIKYECVRRRNKWQTIVSLQRFWLQPTCVRLTSKVNMWHVPVPPILSRHQMNFPCTVLISCIILEIDQERLGHSMCLFCLLVNPVLVVRTSERLHAIPTVTLTYYAPQFVLF